MATAPVQSFQPSNKWLYRHILKRLQKVEPFQVTRNPETNEFVAVNGVCGAVIPGIGFATEAEAAQGWREASALLLSEDFEACIQRLVEAQTLGYVPGSEDS